MSGAYRLVLLFLLLGSAGLGYRSVETILQDPALTPIVDRTADEIVALTDQMIAAEATPERLADLLSRRLAEQPRNWVALQALADLYAERDLPLPAAYQIAWDEESGIVAQTGACLSCAWDIGTCSLSTALLCKAPILLTPVEDLRGITKAGVDYASGTEIDRLDLGLSVVGLSATVLIAASGGTSGTVKAGTALVRLAKGMRLLTPRLSSRMTASLTEGVRWADIPAVRGVSDLPALLRTDALAPITSTFADLGRTQDAVGTAQTLHLLPLIDDAADARAVARVSEALGPRTVSRVEVLGKSRLFRATVRLSDTAIELTAGLVGLLAGLGAAAAHVIQTLMFRQLRRSAHRRR
ncbi:MAG: hypothetical protein U1E06_20595 [Tabrizicola sp.]|uniref:hypothetical protein n=1 Tax=Tabrizicola sp. TaxID=2005166 RepID=UPI00273311B4|nr:hypothetical protein [Tabrizicola sp.]MDP3264833.1 hypothetical protein [Tabrizicola sp.]MDP3647568.1 hypothetical protein [Paracoccaceae bacterium]MDZ4069202.1 hypothetical protein [Tabrizicola sp.]